MASKMVFQMVFISNICTVKMYGKNSVKKKKKKKKYIYTQIWNELIQHNLNLVPLDQSGPKTKKKNLFNEYSLKS